MWQFNRQLWQEQQDDEGRSGGSAGGSGGRGKLDFKDFTGITGQPMRDDLLPPDEIRRLLKVAAAGHKVAVNKERTKRQAIQTLKADKMSRQDYRQQMGSGAGYGANQYKTNPKLANKVQFAGTSQEVTNIPNDSNVKTNEEAKNELINEHRLTHEHRYEAQPKFNPQPKPPGH